MTGAPVTGELVTSSQRTPRRPASAVVIAACAGAAMRTNARARRLMEASGYQPQLATVNANTWYAVRDASPTDAAARARRRGPARRRAAHRDRRRGLSPAR